MKNPVGIVGLFFSLLFMGLFLGDGKQAMIDAYGVAIVIVCWVFYLNKQNNEDFRNFPTHLLLPWFACGTAATLSTIFSSSIGLSLSWMVRFASGYLVYRLFFEISNENTPRLYSVAVVFLVTGACLLSVASYLLPGFRAILPSMNLLDVRYGHSHAADLLVFVVPIVFYLVHKARLSRLARVSIFFVFTTSLFFTFARGAWLVVGLFVVYKLLTLQSKMKPRAIMFVFIAMALFGAAIYYWKPAVVRPQTIGSRLEYWRQGMEAFKDRPVVGNGPGTFSLLSKKHQQLPGQFSWFAHSLPIQTVAEQGAIGIVVFGWLIAVQTAALFRPKAGHALLWGVVLVGAYSLFEYILDYFLVWLLFWSSVGLLVGRTYPRVVYKKTYVWHVLLPLGCVVLYWGLSIISGLYLLKGRYDTAFYVAPYDSVNALLYMDSAKQFQLKDSRRVLLFHKKNPAIHFSLAGLYEKNIQRKMALQHYGLAVENEPTNGAYQLAYAKSFFENGSPNILEKHMVQTCKYTTRTNMEYCTMKIAGEDKKRVFDAFFPRLIESSGIDFPLLYQKALYLAGLDFLESSPAITKDLWEMARIIEPTWGYYHVELASVNYYSLGDSKAAMDALVFCQNFQYVRQPCAKFSKNLEMLPLPGSLEQNILAIPKII